METKQSLSVSRLAATGLPQATKRFEKSCFLGPTSGGFFVFSKDDDVVNEVVFLSELLFLVVVICCMVMNL
jgi:hypothetical protein